MVDQKELDQANQNGDRDCQKMLRDALAEQEKLDSLLIQESRNGHTNAYKALLDTGADVHARVHHARLLCQRMPRALTHPTCGHTKTVEALPKADALSPDHPAIAAK